MAQNITILAQIGSILNNGILAQNCIILAQIGSFSI
ncbi:MAG: hypothetical protein ACI9CQ_002956, partial [Saprospiraceae bacterium]